MQGKDLGFSRLFITFINTLLIDIKTNIIKQV